MKQMREFKFRAWHRGIPKRFRYSGTPAQMLYDEKPGECFIFQNQGQDIEDIMQFTGFVDKNGKEIYEGDILKSDTKFQSGKYQLFTVVFNFGAWEFKNTKNTAATSYPSFYSNAKYLEVIGNIYANPELLLNDAQNHPSPV